MIPKYPKQYKKILYDVTAVATQPPKIITLDPDALAGHHDYIGCLSKSSIPTATKSEGRISFTQAPAGQGVRGFLFPVCRPQPIEPTVSMS